MSLTDKDKSIKDANRRRAIANINSTPVGERTKYIKKKLERLLKDKKKFSKPVLKSKSSPTPKLSDAAKMHRTKTILNSITVLLNTSGEKRVNSDTKKIIRYARILKKLDVEAYSTHAKLNAFIAGVDGITSPSVSSISQ